MALLEIDDIHVFYDNIQALKGISLDVEANRIVTLVGGNGAGKSTTLRAISGLLHPRRGEIRYDRRRDFAARWGELVFTLQHSRADMIAFYQDLKQRVVAQGRAPADCLILPSIDVIVGETDSIAREHQAYVNDLVQTEAGMAQISGHLAVDLSRYPPDQPLADMAIEAGSRGSLDVILQGTAAQNLTLGEAARQFATSELCPQIAGSPETIADALQDMFESHACAGFILAPTLMPGMFEQFCRAVVPVLQARGLFRRDYSGTTLRAHLRD